MDKNMRSYIISLTIFTIIVGSLPYITLQLHFYIHDNDILEDVNLYHLSSSLLFLSLCFIIIYNYIHVLRLFKKDNKYSLYSLLIFLSFIPIWYIISLSYS